MLSLKSALYVLTFAIALKFAFWEERLKRRLTDGVIQDGESVSDYGVLNELSKRMDRERALRSLPREQLSKYRAVVGLKFLFFVVFIAEVIVLQRSK